MKRLLTKIAAMICLLLLSNSSLFSMEKNILGYKEGSTLCLFDVDKKEIVEKIPLKEKFGRPLTFLKDGRHMMFGTFLRYGDEARNRQKEILIFDLKEQKVVKSLPGPKTLGYLFYSPDGKHYCEDRGYDDFIVIKDLATNTEVNRFDFSGIEIFLRRPLTIVFSPQGEYMASGGYAERPGSMFWEKEYGRDIKIWDVRTQKLIRNIYTPTEQYKRFYFWIVDISLSNNAEYIAFTVDNKIQVWKKDSNEAFKIIPLEFAATRVTLSFDGKYVAALMEKKIKIFDVETGNKIYEINTQTDVFFMMFKPPIQRVIEPDITERIEYLKKEVFPEKGEEEEIEKIEIKDVGKFPKSLLFGQ